MRSAIICASSLHLHVVVLRELRGQIVISRFVIATSNRVSWSCARLSKHIPTSPQKIESPVMTVILWDVTPCFCRIVSNVHDCAFALWGLMIALKEMIGMMTDIQELQGYPHLCRTLDIYTSRKELFFVLINERNSKLTCIFQWLSAAVNRHFYCRCRCSWSLLRVHNPLIICDLQFVGVISLRRGRNFRGNFFSI